MVFNATFNNISVISWWSVLLVKEPGVSIFLLDFGAVFSVICFFHSIIQQLDIPTIA